MAVQCAVKQKEGWFKVVSIRRPEQLQSYSTSGGKGGAMPQPTTSGGKGGAMPQPQGEFALKAGYDRMMSATKFKPGEAIPTYEQWRDKQPYQNTTPYTGLSQDQNQLPRTTFQSQYGMPQPYMGGKGMGYGYQPPMYQPAPYSMGGKGMGYGSQPSYNPYAAPQGGKGMGYGSQPSYNPYATQSPYVNYNQPSYGSIGGKGGSIGGKGGTAGGKGG